MLNQGGCDLYEIREDFPKLLYIVSVVCHFNTSKCHGILQLETILKKSQRKEHNSTREIAENLLFHLRVVSARGERFRSS